MTFWIVTGLLALAVASLIAMALLRKRHGVEPAAAYDLRIYRDQLDEVDRDLQRGLIDMADAERVRAEVSRRILAADAQIKSDETGRGSAPVLTGAVAMLAAIAVIGGSLALYGLIGAPGYGDFGLQDRIALAEVARANRPGQAEAEATLPARPQQPVNAEHAALVAKLRETVAERPEDLQGQILLARNEAALGNFQAAYAAQAQVLALKGATASVADYVDYADMLILAAGGYVSPAAEAALETALERDPGNGPARYYWGLMQAQTGRPDLAFRTWEQLLRVSPPNAPWMPPLTAQIEEMAARAGVEFELPAPALISAPRGPTTEDMEAASEMSAEDRAAMIEGMVQGLSDRLAAEGGPPTDWARLIGALGVLGETDRAQAIFDEAVVVFADDPMASALIRDAGARAGLRQ